MEYTVITATPLSTPIEKVNAMIAKGWHPQGGILNSINGDYYWAMVKK